MINHKFNCNRTAFGVRFQSERFVSDRLVALTVPLPTKDQRIVRASWQDACVCVRGGEEEGEREVRSTL